MTNEYFTVGDALADHTQARGTAVDAKFAAVEAGFDMLPTKDELTGGKTTYCEDTGTANTYVLTPTHAITAYAEGQRFFFFAANTNTAASTVNISGKGARALKRADGDDLNAGDIIAGAPVEILDTGTECRIVGWHGSDINTVITSTAASASAASGSASAASSSAGTASAAATAAGNSQTAAAASAVSAAVSATTAATTVAQWVIAAGTADAITAAYPTTVTTLTDGLVLAFRAKYANATTTPTFKADGTTAHTITKDGGVALSVGDIVGALAEYLVRYNLANTRWELLNPANNGMKYGITSVPTGTATTLLAIAPYTEISITAGYATNYFASCDVRTDPTGGSGLILVQSQINSGGTFSISGSNLQYTHAAGSTKDIIWRARVKDM